MRIAFNPSTVAALTSPPNNKDITFDLRGQNIFARGVKFYGTDTWRPVVDNLTSNSATSSLSANQGRVLAGLINGKSDSDHNHDGRYLKLTGGTLTGNLVGTSAMFSGRFYGNGDDEGIIIKPSSNGYAGLILGTHDGERSIFYYKSGNAFWRYGNGSGTMDIYHPKKSGTIALTSDIPSKDSWNYDDRYLKLTGGTMSGQISSNYSVGTWIAGCTNAILKATADGYNSLICAPIKSGNISISAWTAEDNLNFGYAKKGKTENSFDTRMYWDAPNNNLHAAAFTGHLYGTADNATNAVNADTTDNVHIIWAGELTSTTYLAAWEANGSALRAIKPANVSVGNSDKVDGYHASDLVKFYLSPMANDATADSAKNWFVNTLPSLSGAIVYNVPGSEKTIIAGKSSAYGHMLQLNYDNTYLKILRYYQGSWKSTDWEKISAGYADSAGSASHLEGGGIPGWGTLTAANGFTNVSSWDYGSRGAYGLCGKGNILCMQLDGYFYQNEGQYRVLDTSDVAGLKGDLTVHQYLSNTDVTWWPLIWGGSSHANTSDSTGAVYKSHDKLSWQTSSQTLYATHLRTTYIDLENSRGIVKVASGGTSPYKGIKLPTLGADGIGMFSRFSNASDEGGIIISEDTSVIYNSFDTGWGLSVRDKDRGQTDISGDGTIAFGIRQDYRAYSLGGFEKSGSDNTYVLLGGGGHKLESALDVNYATSAGNADTVDRVHLEWSGELTYDQYSYLAAWTNDGIKIKAVNKNQFAKSDHTHSIYAVNENYGGFKKAERLPTSGFYQSNESESGGNAPWKSWMHLINCQHSNTNNNYALQIAASFYDNNTFKIRVTNNSVNNVWRDIIHSGNISSQSVASATKLQTARRIWGQSFDGTADVNGTIYINNGDSENGAIILNNNVNTHARISAIGDQVVFNTGSALRFGGTEWEYSDWAGLKYDTAANTVYLGIADGTVFNYYSSKRSNGTLKLPGIKTITPDSGARIGGSGGDLYLGNANNNGWVKVQDICSHNGSDYWYIYQSGNAVFNYIKSKTNAYIVGNLEAGQIIRGGSSQMWVNGRNGALLRETSVAGYHTLWSLKTTDGSWDFGEYNAGSDWNNIPVLSYITDSNYNSGNNAPTYQIKFPLASGTVALTSDILNYYWANVKISTSSSTTTSPTVSNLTATNSIKMGNILLEYADEINNITNNGSLNLNCRNSGNVSLCAGGGKVGIGTRYPSHELYVMGYTHTKGFGINPYYLSDSGLLPTISPGDGYTYRCLEIGSPTKISCIIADKTYLPGSTRGVLLNFKEGFDGQLVLLKDLQNYGSGNGYFWVMPSGCKIIRADGSSILIGQNQISNTYDDGRSRFFIYSSKYSAWIEFLCANIN